MPLSRQLILQGVAVSPGISIGSPFFYYHELFNVSREQVAPEDIDIELKRYHKALETTRNDILLDQKIAKERSGSEAARIFDSHILILKDVVLVEEIEKFIRDNQLTALYAVSKIMKQYQATFEKLENEYFSQRAFDIEDVARRLLRNIKYLEDNKIHASIISDRKIIVANNFFPSDIVNFHKQQVLGIVTEYGGETSHTAIFARSMEVPAVIGVEDIYHNIKDCSLLILDGIEGKVIINPNSETLKVYKEKEHTHELHLKEDFEISREKAITKDGVEITIASNIQRTEEIENVLKWSSEGVGLFRTEFIFEESVGILTEDEQFRIFDDAAERVYPHPLTIRLADVGGDKFNSRLSLHEDNPFLGLRGIRLLLDMPKFLIPHLRASLRASHRKNVRILIPFVSNIDEMMEIIGLINREKAYLSKLGVKIDKRIPLGVVMEIPSAVLIADKIAEFVDFFSIGSNDLTQYILAADRGNKKVAYIYDTLHPAVLKFFKLVIDSANRNNKAVSLCGQIGGDANATPLLIGLGLKELSMTPFLIPEIKKVIRNLNFKEAEKIAQKALSLYSGKQVHSLLINYFQDHNY